MPLISVIMAVHNGEKYLTESINSIINQTYQDFEFIIIDDGSTDNSRQVLEQYTKLDQRILVFHQEKKGLPTSLNRGIELAQGKYMARMDADDISLPERFAKQVAFMEKYPEIGVCGTWVKTFGTEQVYENQYPVDHDNIKCCLLFGTGIAHPSILLRKQFLEQYNLRYNPEYTYCQDYELWVHSSNYFKLANIPEVLLLYRLHPKQMGQAYSQTIRLRENQKVWSSLFEKLQIHVTEENWSTHKALWQFKLEADRTFINQTEEWLMKLTIANKRVTVYQEPYFSHYVGDRWFIVCDKARILGIWMALKFWFSPLTQYSSLSQQKIWDFCIDCAKKDVKKLLKFLKLRKTID